MTDNLTGQQITKITLMGPAPYGGTYTSTLDDPSLDGLLAAGYTVYRIWTVRFDADQAILVSDSGYLR